MKYIHNKAFPYPVLSPANEDFVRCNFQPTIKWKAEQSKIKLCAQFTLSEDNLIKLIAKKKAKFAVEIHCAKTYTRRIVDTHGKKEKLSSKSNTYAYSDEFEFQKGDLYGQVITNCYIISADTIEDYVSDNFNPDYNNSKYKIEKSSVLAVYPPIEHYVDTEREKPITTFFKLVLNENLPDGQFNIGYEDEGYIKFMLSGKTKSSVETMRKTSQGKPLLWSGLYFPAILETLHEMQENPEEHQDKKWFVGINKALKKKDPNVDFESGKKNDDLLEIVQLLMDNPLGKILFQEG